MYCSSCGVSVAQSLSYCNYCGAKLNSGKGDSVPDSSEVKPELLVAAMVALFIFGLVAITVLIGVMKAVLGLNVGQILAFTMLSFVMMLLLEGICIWLLLGRRRGAGKTLTQVSKERSTKELNAAQAPLLPEPVPSVTEHTTRAFDPVYKERTSK